MTQAGRRKFIEDLAATWEKYPMLRFGQFVNLIAANEDVFFVPDAVLRANLNRINFEHDFQFMMEKMNRLSGEIAAMKEGAGIDDGR